MIGFMLASSVPWYLPVLFLSCLGWAFAFYLDEALNHRPLLQRLYRWAPPLMVAGLVISRAADIFSLSSTNPEVAYVLDQNASMAEQLQLLFTGQGVLEGALFAFLSFSLFAPFLPSLRGSSPDTSDFIRSRMMTHAGVWALVLLMVLFQQDMYASADTVPVSPTVELMGWATFVTVVLFTLLLMMSGEVLTATAHMASSGETSLLFQRAIIKILFAGTVAWACLFQTEVYTDAWWDRPLQNERLAMALVIAVYATWAALPHAFSTVAEGLQGPSSSQAISLACCLGLTVLVSLVLSGSTADAVDVYGEGFDAFITGWRGVAVLMFVGAASMILPTVGFDAAHHPEAWWFRITVMMFLPLGVLVSDAGWLLHPALLLTGGAFPLVYMGLIDGRSSGTEPTFLFGLVCWVVCCFLTIAAAEPVQKLQSSLLALVLVSAAGGVWLRRDKRAFPQ